MCSTDAIVPTWAYMLVATALFPHAKFFFFGSPEQLEGKIFDEVLSKIDWTTFSGKKVVVKGCSKVDVPVYTYVESEGLVRMFQTLCLENRVLRANLKRLKSSVNAALKVDFQHYSKSSFVIR